jgi:hypothetical protein
MMKNLIILPVLFVLLSSLAGCAQAVQQAEAAASTATPLPSPTEAPFADLTETYAVNITAADFVEVVNNPYFPLIPGTTWVYEARLEDGSTERIELEILSETRKVNGVAATILHDSVYIDGELAEETFDWYAQDTDGNVWYLGEDVDNYENGVLIDHAGAWEWGVDGALPGVIMWADPVIHLDEAYYQEYYAGEAEDMGQVLSVDESVTVPVGSFENVVQTFDFSSLDPDIQAHKFYAPGIGTVKEVELLTGEEVVLVEYAPADKVTCAPAEGATVDIATAKLYVEYNATDEDLGVHGAFDVHDPEVKDQAVELIKASLPNILFIHLPDTDRVGHAYGWMSENQFHAITFADRMIGEIMTALEQGGYLDTTLLIVTSDHGGRDKFHGDDSPIDRTIPWLAAGPRVSPGVSLHSQVNIYDTAATATYALDLPIPEKWDGQPVMEIFK